MAKDMISAYRKVCLDLKVLQAYETIARKKLEAAHAVVFKGKAPSSMMCYVPLDTALEAYNLAVDDYNETTAALDELISVKTQMEETIMKLSPVEQIILTMHVESGMKLKQIAERSNYSYSHLRNTASELGKRKALLITA